MFGRIAGIAVALCVAFCSFACGSADHANAPYIAEPDGGDDPDKPIPNSDPCASPNKGCACEKEAELVECGQVERRSGDYVSCTMGYRTCTDGKWGDCVGDRVATLYDPPGAQRNQGLGATQACADNPCDPFCQRFVDDATNLNLPDGGSLIDAPGLSLKANVPLPTGAGCTSLSMTPTPQNVTVTAINTTFVKGEYFNQINKSATSIPSAWAVTATRQEANINFDWGSGAPGPAGIGVDTFSVRWTGSVIPATTEAYTFYTETDDGARLWVNGTLVIDKWQDQGATEYASPTINLTAGVPALFRFEYYENSGGASAKLRWSSPMIAKTVIPTESLGSPTGARSRLTVTPASPTFSLGLLPANCFSGTLSAAWALDRYDVATVTNGVVNLISAVPGTLNLTAYTGQYSATGKLNVTVNAADTNSAPTGAVANFAKAVSGTDPMTVLYPYDKTVLPIGLTAPVIQWDTGGTAASAVKITLSYPATGTATFTWSQIIPETTPPSATIPQSIWKDLENTGKGQDVKFTVQRVLGSTPAPALSRTLRFSSAPVRGLIYYTQYQRGGSTNMMVADPGSTSAAHSAFASVNGCPVCHSLSANGNVFATADRGSSGSTNGGLSTVQPGGSLSPLADFVPAPARTPYQASSSDWRGFAWAPLTPDGKYALSANNIWGNSKQEVVGIDPNTRTVITPTTLQSGGSGTGLLAVYYPNKTFTVASPLWKRIEPVISYDFGLLAPQGNLFALDYSARRTGLIQAPTTETYKFEIETVDGVKLIVNGTTVIDQMTFQSALGTSTFSGSIAMTAGSKVSIQLDQLDSALLSSIKLYWSSPSVPRQLVPQQFLYPNDGIHGLEVSYYGNNSFTAPVVLKRLEPDVNAYWGTNSPAAESALPSDNFSDTWQGRIESPYTGLLSFCVDSDDDVKITFNGNVIINRSGLISLDFCSLGQVVTQGTLYTLRIDHVEKTGNANLNLRWNYALLNIAERIPTSNFYPPVAYTVPTNGLTATYYGDGSFGRNLLVNNPLIQNAFTRYDANIYADFGSGRTEYSQLTSSDNWSARWTGFLTAPCAGTYEFRTLNNVDDGGRMWLDQKRVASTWAYGPFGGATYLTAGDHDFKFDWYENTGGAAVQLQWKVNCNGADWTAIPTTAFKPTGDFNRSGMMGDGGDNGNGTSYAVWQTPSSAGTDPVDVSSQSAGNWGLGSTVMMVPAFAPDASKLVFVDGDSSAGAGWRKGLSVFDFSQSGKLFSNRRSIVNNWPAGDTIKWPTFESDSRSVIYQTTVPGDVCCRNSWTKYGYMGPTNYYEDPGRLYSVDSQAATPTPVPLTLLNTGERAVDANKAYQPTMAPKAAGGYRWVVYTSTRPYGNKANVASVQGDYSNTGSYSPMLNYTDLQSQLWVSAIDDTQSGSTDRSHPGFWLPNQNYAASASSGYINERGFWALEGCKNSGSSCEVDEDCCGGSASPKTSLCRLDTPVTDTPTRHCGAVPTAGSCIADGGTCASSSECCLGSICASGKCAAPPPILVYGAANFERTYTASCGEGTKPVWRFFDWQTVTPSDSKLEFFAQSASSPSGFATLPVAPAVVSTAGVVALGSASGAPNTTWIGADVGAKLISAGYKPLQYLKVTIRLIPNTGLTAAPVLTNWRQNYSCVPAE